MNDILTRLRKYMADNTIDCLLINSTNEFLVEYNELEQNSRYKLTNFSGSTGDVLLTQNNVFLFVDGRYHIQAELETDKNIVTLVKLQTGQTFLNELIAKIPDKAILGVFARKVSQKDIETLAKQVKIKLLDRDPLDDESPEESQTILELPTSLTGLTTGEKIEKLSIHEDEAILLTNLEDVSYIFNLRDFSKPYSSKINAKAVIENDKAQLFFKNDLDKFEKYITDLNKTFIIDKSTINAYDYNLIKNKAKEATPVKLMKSQKNSDEIEHYKYAFAQTDKTMLAIREYINKNENISEYDIAIQLEKEFKNNGATNLSFNSIVAKDKNSALAHYSKSSNEEILKDGSLILIDCGAYFEGGLATDITRVFVKGTPTELQKTIYTTVLKAFLLGFNTTEITSGFDIDFKVREYLKNNAPEGFVFNHGLGHGIGINVHEAPPNLGIGEVAKTQLKNGMCFTIEPGLYNSNHFGIRLENSCYIEDNKIKSFVKMPFEKNLINYSMLDDNEIKQLDKFGVI